MWSWVSENLDFLGTITISAIFQHSINYVLQRSLQYPLEAWEACAKLLSTPKIGTTEEKGRIFKKTVNRLCLPNLCSNCSSSCARVLRIKKACLKTPSPGRNSHSLWVFHQVAIIDACLYISVNIYKHDIIKADSFALSHNQSQNDISSVNLICYCNCTLHLRNNYFLTYKSQKHLNTLLLLLFFKILELWNEAGLGKIWSWIFLNLGTLTQSGNSHWHFIRTTKSISLPVRFQRK